MLNPEHTVHSASNNSDVKNLPIPLWEVGFLTRILANST